MLHVKRFFFPKDSNQSASDERQKELEDLVNEIGEEKIFQIVCGGIGSLNIVYTIFYRD